MARSWKGASPSASRRSTCSSRTSTARARFCAPAWCPTTSSSATRLPPGDERAERAARHLRPHRRHRHRPRRRRDLLRARGQCAHALRRLLHAGEPRDHDAAVPGPVRAPPRRAGRELSGRAAGDAANRWRRQRRARPDRRAAHARRLQLRLLRALVPRRQARRRAGRGPRPLRRGRHRLHAHDPGAARGST